MNLNFITKRNIFFFSIFFLSILTSLIFIQETCDYNALGWCWQYWSEIGLFGGMIFVPSLFLFFLSIIIIPLPSYVFDNWKKFAIWSVPLTIVLSILITNWGGSGGGGVGVYSMDLRPLFLIFLYGWFLIHSLIIILLAWYQAKSNKDIHKNTMRWHYFIIYCTIVILLISIGFLFFPKNTLGIIWLILSMVAWIIAGEQGVNFISSFFSSLL